MAGPLRTCRVCRAKKPKAELVRWVERPEGLVRDPSYRLEGRGLYSCRGEHETMITKSKRGRK